MTITPTDSDLRQLIASTVRREIGPLTPETNLQDALYIDSLDVLRLLAAAERRYGIYITDEEMVELRCYGDLLELLGIEAGEPVS
ncbi:MAG: acyl carrier protein [Alphaproteobacteria bacterium]|nr:acyl carrier protein [Alphaproteobacteria bacterium]